jgi:dGTPase
MHDVDRDQEEWRSDADVDVDRLLYSPEFRRLAGVTQVVPPQDDFHFHDRLTHSIKVAQVAETLARQLVMSAATRPDLAGVDLSRWVDPRHCYAAGLAHDIGHPPFGHAGEEALQRILESAEDDDFGRWSDEAVSGDDELATEGPAGLEGEVQGRVSRPTPAMRSFEGNAQSMRIVARLSARSSVAGGLNLTLRTLAAIAKYPWLREEHPVKSEKLAMKWSFYAEESGTLEKLTDQGFIAVRRSAEGEVDAVDRWVEAEIMDWADDISYAVHDVDDFYRAGLIPLAQALQVLGDKAPPAVNWNTTDFDFVEDGTLRESLKYIAQKLKDFQLRQPEREAGAHERDFAQAFQRISEFSKGPCPRVAFSGTSEAHRMLQRFSSAVIAYLSGAAELRRSPDGTRIQLYLQPTAVLVAEFFKALNSYYVVESVSLAAMQYGQERSIRSLYASMLDLAYDWVEKRGEGRVSGRLPARLRSYLSDPVILQGSGSSGLEESAQTEVDVNDVSIAVIDYITSLRDVQAARLTAQLAGSRDNTALTGRWLNT